MDASVVVVTGANGFLGSYAVNELRKSGFDVVSISRSGAAPQDASHRCFTIDLEEELAVEQLPRLVSGRVKALVHFAAAIPQSTDGKQAEEAGMKNLRMDRHVRRICEKLGCSLVYGSSGSVYPADRREVKTENDEVSTDKPYAREKLASEREYLKQITGSEFHFTSLRITAPYGPGQRISTVVKVFLERALRNESLTYHGSGAREQDFIHAADVGRAVVCAVRQSPGGVFNIGAGVPVTMKQLAELVVRAVPNCRSEVRPSGKPDPQEMRSACFSIEKSRRELGWWPQITLEQGIRQWVEMAAKDANANRHPQ